MIWANTWPTLLFVFTLAFNFAASSELGCTFTKKYGVFYSSNASRSHGNVLKTLHSESEDDCQKTCCDFERCNLYMYLTALSHVRRSPKNVTCFLLYCREKSRCLTRNLPGNITGESVVGVKQGSILDNGSVNQVSDNTLDASKTNQYQLQSPVQNTATALSTIHAYIPINHTPLVKSSNKFKTNANYVKTNVFHATILPIVSTNLLVNSLYVSINSTSLHSKPGTFLRPSVTYSRILTMMYSQIISPRMHSLQTPRKENKKSVIPSSSLMSSAFMPNNSTFVLSNSASPKTISSHVSVNVNKEVRNVTVTNSSLSVPRKPHFVQENRSPWKSFSSEHKSHTTPVSLVISLIIGILMFGSVIFLIARRWSEQCSRRSYSRVDYLLNDYD